MIQIDEIDTEEKIRRALPVLQKMVSEGLVAMTDVEVLHRIACKKDR
jgi:PII-like signaling protein